MTIRRVGAVCAFLLCGAASAQTTQGLISGRLEDSRSGAPVAGATITYYSAATAIVGTARSDLNGYYFLPLLSPGFYRVRAAAEGYQPREVQELELPVAGRIELNFPLRPLSDVWESGQYRSVRLPGSKTIVTFYGPDVDSSRSGSFEAAKGRRGALESSVSQVIDPIQVRDLPLAGRDVYTMLVTQPGVTADNGTARGLGLSINGQRPSSSNFMLDGIENNNFLVTGPLTAIAPEAVQEYRVSTNNFSAAYGRTAGFVANAVSKSGGSEFHGIGYSYLKNEALNANGYQENLAGLTRLKARENQFGGQIGGPVVKERLFFSGAVEQLRSRGRQQTVAFELPTPAFNSTFPDATRASRRLLDRFPSPAPGEGRNLTQRMWFNPPVTVNRTLSIGRLDYTSKSGSDRLMGRVSINRVSRPDFIWSPYKDFISGLDQETFSVAVSHVRTIRPSLLNEAKVGRSGDDLGWDRPFPEIASIAVGPGQFEGTIEMPGSPAFYAYRNNNKTWELLDNLVWTRGRHVYTFGGGLLLRASDGFLTGGRDGQYTFLGGLIGFALDRPDRFRVAVTRRAFPNLERPSYDRNFRYKQYFLFAQDTFKASSRLALNYGVRYENYGAPRNTNPVKDPLLQYRGGVPSLDYPSAQQDQQLYASDNNDLAGRFGFSYDLRGNGSTLLRGAYGIFYDRPFDNLWQNVRANDYTIPEFTIRGASFDFLRPISTVLPLFSSQGDIAAFESFPYATGFDSNFRTAYAQSYFLGVQHQVADNWSVEINGAGSLGRKLIITDKKNRLGDYLGGFHSWRTSDGLSNYQALTTSVRYRGSRNQFQLSYTWSHSIDHQSDALTGEFFDLLFSKVGGGSRDGVPALSLEGDLRRDRGSSDFDQRHNLVFLSIWDLPRALQGMKAGWLLRDWKFSQLAAFRSGFPFSVRSPVEDASGPRPFNNRADVLNPAQAVLDDRERVAGGVRLLRLQEFQVPPGGALGNTGRNAFRGPGLYNIDLSLARSFPLPWIGESGRLTVRADAFNFLNHANLGNPDALITSPDFGVARYGRSGAASGFPAVAPLNETSRQIQMILRIEF